jgi:hypothetical protein
MIPVTPPNHLDLLESNTTMFPGRCGIGLAAAFLLLAGGCGSKTDEDLPPIYQVSGKVVFQDGKPYRGGSIELRAKDDSEKYRMFGRIDSDGEFMLQTIGGKQPVDGAFSGEFYVTVIPDQGEDQTDVRRQPASPRKLFRIEPRDGFELIITLDTPSPK